MKKLSTFEKVSLVLMSPFVIAIIYQLATTGETAGLSSASVKERGSVLTKCQKLRRSYNAGLQDRTKAIMSGYHSKSYDIPVAYSADDLMKSPECILKTMDKGKIIMWKKQSDHFRLERMMK